jgi:acetyl-CoA C-acetyltransferase
MPQVRDAVIVGYLRSAFSRSSPKQPEKDVFNDLRADDLGALVLKKLLKQTGVKPASIDEVIVGAARATGEQMTLGGRLVNFLAELPVSVPAHFVDRTCGASMTAMHHGALAIMCGYSEIVVSVGIEQMTHVPLVGDPAIINPLFYYDPRFKDIDIEVTLSVGYTAEKLAKFSGISREDMDKWALRSHRLAGKAIKEGFFRDEILPIEGTAPDGKKIVVNIDQTVRANMTLEQLKKLKPIYGENGMITAGNASPLNSGATAVLLMSREKAKELGLKPMASIVSMGWAGVDPTMMGMGTVPAVRKALKAAKLSVNNIDFWEINEAFAVVTLYAIRELGIDSEKVNVKGGAMAIGHPVGATGNRMVGTLAKILNMNGGEFGVATMGCGGGQGVATVIRNER